MKDEDSLSILNMEDTNTIARQADKDEGKYHCSTNDVLLQDLSS